MARRLRNFFNFCRLFIGTLHQLFEEEADRKNRGISAEGRGAETKRAKKTTRREGEERRKREVEEEEKKKFKKV